MTLEAWVDLMSKGSLLLGLIVFVWGLKQRWWVMGAEYEEMKAERDYERAQKNLTADIADDAKVEAVRRGNPVRQRRDPNA